MWWSNNWENVNLQKEGKEKEKKKKVSGINDVAVNVTQQERSNNKYYALAFRYRWVWWNSKWKVEKLGNVN